MSQTNLPTRSGSAFREEFGNEDLSPGDVIFDARHRYQHSTASNASGEAQGLLQNQERQPKFSDDVMGELERRHARASNTHSLATSFSEYPPTISSRGPLLATSPNESGGYSEASPQGSEPATQPLLQKETGERSGSPPPPQTVPLTLSTTNPDPQ